MLLCVSSKSTSPVQLPINSLRFLHTSLLRPCFPPLLYVKTTRFMSGGTWALKKAQENKLEVAEMRMIRWMCAVKKLDKIRNERIRKTTKVGDITKKVQERRLKWYGHVMRREEHYVGRMAMVMKVQGRRKRGRPKRRWLDKVKEILKRRDCRLMMCTTVLHGGVCHNSGNKMEEKKKNKFMSSGDISLCIWPAVILFRVLVF